MTTSGRTRAKRGDAPAALPIVRLRSPRQVRPVRGGAMRLLRPFALIFITATLPPNEAFLDALRLLQEAAVKAGCPKPRTSMRWLGGPEGVEVEIRCVEVPNGR